MNVGYFAIGAGLAAQPDIIALVAQMVEQAGFHSLWAPEHVVLLDQYASRYRMRMRRMAGFPYLRKQICSTLLRR